MKRIITLLLIFTLIFTVTACSASIVKSTSVEPSGQFTSEGTGNDENGDSTTTIVYVEYDNDDLDTSWDSNSATYITVDGTSGIVVGDGATIENGVILITSAGSYSLRGVLEDGQIIVNTGGEEIVKLILN